MIDTLMEMITHLANSEYPEKLALLHKKCYDSLINVGFTEEQAILIITSNKSDLLNNR